ncbi:pyruvate:ferredoxin (flavodoxin) oxidoreductase [candidate division WOR-3 bacterium]|nr:pyruvate:ferredoxin (flavodoxin) oxidoreductase [candidate division WOR-3 bacterium]
MPDKKIVMIDGNTAAAYIAHATNEVIAIYPITPSSNMGELADEWSSKKKTNIWGNVPVVVELQSEGGASGAIHGSLSAGALTSTFTASQGLLLMLPNMHKIAGELLPTVFHIAARSLSCQALSIFGDHSDVMAARTTGYSFLFSANPQESMDMALIAQSATLKSRVPFLHIFDGFRTSHEIQNVEEIPFSVVSQMIDNKDIENFRKIALNPEKPTIKGTSQNPDVFFQGRETVNPFYVKVPSIVQEAMDKFQKLTGRQYKLFEYIGHPEAERVMVIMGSGADVAEETVQYLSERKERVGLIKVRLFRPFDKKTLLSVLPITAKSMAVLDRTKEPGSVGEPLYTDISSALNELSESGEMKFAKPKVYGGRYGLSSKEFTPAMVKGILQNLSEPKPKNHFTVGIVDDVSNTSLLYNHEFSIEHDGFEGKFYGLGSDGTVGANKNSIKIIGENTGFNAQGFFVYDSKKSGAVTVSHLRFGAKPILSHYLVHSPSFVAVHNPSFLDKYDVTQGIKKGGTLLLNTPYDKSSVWSSLTKELQSDIIKKDLKVYAIDAISLSEKIGLGTRINTIMQTAFFEISKILPKDKYMTAIENSIKKTYGSKGEKVVEMNINAVRMTLENLFQLDIPQSVTSTKKRKFDIPDDAPEYVKKVALKIFEMKGDEVPVSAMPCDGTFPTGTTKYEKRNIAVEIPVWDPDSCLQCATCSFVCPHAAIRVKLYDRSYAEKAPPSFKSVQSKKHSDMVWTVQVAPEDCTGCGLCIESCPGRRKDAKGNRTEYRTIEFENLLKHREEEKANFEYFLSIPQTDEKFIDRSSLTGTQLLPTMFEFSGACAGCGETPYIKLVTQLYGDRSLIANATGCSSIYGGNLPTTPYTKRNDGRGPSWSNSLFEDNAEFGYGMFLASEKLKETAVEIASTMIEEKHPLKEILKNIMDEKQDNQISIELVRDYISQLRRLLPEYKDEKSQKLLNLLDYLVKRSVWIFGGDGWAYDIGYGGLDHVLASGKNVNVLVLDTEVYSNTGGQMSKATPLAATARFAAAGKPLPKKDLGLLAMTYGYIYVAQIALLANYNQTIKAITEAESYPGPSLIIAYSHCINHGIDMRKARQAQLKAVNSGYWILYRYNPLLCDQKKNPLVVDAPKEIKISFEEYAYNENRYRSLSNSMPDRAKMLLEKAQEAVTRRFEYYKKLENLDVC